MKSSRKYGIKYIQDLNKTIIYTINIFNTLKYIKNHYLYPCRDFLNFNHFACIIYKTKPVFNHEILNQKHAIYLLFGLLLISYFFL